MSTDVRIMGRIILTMNVKSVTGLHIGGTSIGLEIGGVDNPILRNPLTNQPYIPGSSIKGKIRSLLEKLDGAPQNQSMGKDVKIHVCENFEKYVGCKICKIFGLPGEKTFGLPSRLIVRDVEITPKSIEALKSAITDYEFSEVKTEVAIDRVTSAASPRNIERVPAGTVFGPAEMVFTLYGKEDLALFKHVIEGLQLLEDDYLGGSGSRGSGKVQFTDITLTTRGGADYTKENPVGNYKSVQELANAYTKMEFADLFKG